MDAPRRPRRRAHRRRPRGRSPEAGGAARRRSASPSAASGRSSSTSTTQPTTAPTTEGIGSSGSASGRLYAAVAPTIPSTTTPASPTPRSRTAMAPVSSASRTSSPRMLPLQHGLVVRAERADGELAQPGRRRVDHGAADRDHRLSLRPHQRRHQLGGGQRGQGREQPRQRAEQRTPRHRTASLGGIPTGLSSCRPPAAPGPGSSTGARSVLRVDHIFGIRTWSMM